MTGLLTSPAAVVAVAVLAGGYWLVDLLRREGDPAPAGRSVQPLVRYARAKGALATLLLVLLVALRFVVLGT